MKEIVFYRQGGIWIANVCGFLITLHYSRQSKRSVLEWASENYPDFNYSFS